MLRGESARVKVVFWSVMAYVAIVFGRQAVLLLCGGG